MLDSERYLSFIRDVALPHWSSAGFDESEGRFHERLLFDGANDAAAPLRSMVQARQIYVYSHGYRLGWCANAEPATRAYAAMRRDFGSDEGGFHVSRDFATGQIDTTRDTYAHAFYLFAIGHLVLATGDRSYLADAVDILTFMDETLADRENGGYIDCSPDNRDFKRQNPHMHLLEALHVLHECDPAGGYLERAQAIVDLCQSRFVDAETGALIEYFNRDWSRRDSADGTFFEPGHHFEWIWLLDRHRLLGGRISAEIGDRLWDVALGRGLLGDRVIEEVDLAMQPRSTSSRIWPHTEAIKAACVRHEAGDTQARPFCERMAATLMRDFLGRPDAGLWIDRMTAAGEPLAATVPASSLYHLVLAATEMERVFFKPVE